MQQQADVYEAFCATDKEVRDQDGNVIAWGNDEFITQVIARLLNQAEKDSNILIQRRSICE